MSGDTGCDEELITSFENQGDEIPKYSEIIEVFLCETDSVKKEIFLFGLISMTYLSDWYYFFPLDTDKYFSSKYKLEVK